MVAWLERHQVPLYLATMVLGAALGLAFPAVTSTWEPAVPPLIAVLLWSTFLGIPLTQLGDGLRDRRFLLVHVLDMDNADNVVRGIKQRYERPLMEIFP